jgi:hypothetical protein
MDPVLRHVDRRDRDGARGPRCDGRRVDPGNPPPAPGRRPPVREEQEGERKQPEEKEPADREEDRSLAKRQVVVAEAIDDPGVFATIAPEQRQAPRGEEEPADRIAWLAARDNEAHRRVRHLDEERSGRSDQRSLMRERNERKECHRERKEEAAEDQGRPRRGQAGTGRGRICGDAANLKHARDRNVTSRQAARRHAADGRPQLPDLPAYERFHADKLAALHNVGQVVTYISMTDLTDA